MASLQDIIQRIRERAYALWEGEGRPNGRSEAHWQQAEAEIGASEADPETLPPADVLAPDPPPDDGEGASEADAETIPPGNPKAA